MPLANGVDAPASVRFAARPGPAANAARSRAAAARPEIELMVACLRVGSGPDHAARITSLLDRQLDWADLVGAARRHAVVPWLYRVIRRSPGSDVPDAALDALRQRTADTRHRNLLLASELLTLVAAFEGEAIPVAPYRGPTLAADVYGDLALREFIDLDLLVRPRDVDAARQLLSRRGYRESHALSPLRRRAHQRYWCDYEFRRDAGRARVEIHWALNPPRFVPRDPAGLWDRLRPVRMCRSTVRTLSPEDLLTVLCTHGAKHAWDRLAWLSDIARLVVAHPEIDWDRLLTEAHTLRVSRMVLLGLALGRRLLDVPLPAEVVRRTETDPTVVSLAASSGARLLRDEPPPADAASLFRFHLRLMDTWSRRVGFCVTPTVTEVVCLGLPRPLYFVYYLARLVRLVRQHGLPAVGRLIGRHGSR